MQASTLQVGVGVAVVFVLIVLFTITDIQLTSTTTVSVSGHHQFSQGTQTVSQISQAQAQFSARRVPHVLRGDLDTTRDQDILSTPETPRVSVRVYVEALCPDSARFVVYDLASDRFPSSLWDIVDINYIFWVRFHSFMFWRTCLTALPMRLRAIHGITLWSD